MAKKQSARRGRGRPLIQEITPAQKRTLKAIRDHVDEYEEAPTLAELCDTLGMTAAPVYQSISQLVRKGYVMRDRHTRRGLRIVREPIEKPVGGLRKIALLGRISAGKPLDCPENRLGIACVPAAVTDDDCYALMISGDSMIGAGMRDGGVVVVRPQPMCRSGEIVVAMIDNESTIKRLYVNDNIVELRAENPRHPPIRVSPDSEFRIFGKVIWHDGLTD